MQQFNKSMNLFRLSARELFNNAFLPYHDLFSVEVNERFSRVESELFAQLIVKPYNLVETEYGRPSSNIHVSIRDYLEDIPVMINRDLDGGYWDNPIKLMPRQVEMSFVSFFDWSSTDIKDNKYVRAIIGHWPDHVDMRERHVLIECEFVEFSVSR